MPSKLHAKLFRDKRYPRNGGADHVQDRCRNARTRFFGHLFPDEGLEGGIENGVTPVAGRAIDQDAILPSKR